jgi:TolB-like protein
MNKPVGMLILVLMISPGSTISAQDKTAGAVLRLQEGVRAALELVSSSYRDMYSTKTMRTAVAVVEFESPDGDSESREMANTVTTYVEAELSRSLLFYLVDRKNLDAVLSEIELSMTGLFDTSEAPQLGALQVASALIVGKVSKVGEDYHVGIKLLDLASGTIVAAAAFEVPGEDLAIVATELQYSYVAANGIGIALGGGAILSNPRTMTTLFNFLYEAGLTYRPSRNWMYTLSFTGKTGLEASSSPDYEYTPGADGLPLYSDYQPGGLFTSDPGNPDSIEDFMERGYGETGPKVTSRYAFTMIGINAQYTANFSPAFNIGFSGGPLLHLGKPTMTVQYGSGELGGIFYRQRYWDADLAAYDYGPAIDTKPLAYTFNSFVLAGGRIEVRPEVFITPRLALTLRAGYLYTIPLEVSEVLASNASWQFSEDNGDVDPETWEPADYATTDLDEFDVGLFQTDSDASVQYASWKYYGLNPLVNPEGKRWIFDISNAYVIFTLTFYF